LDEPPVEPLKEDVVVHHEVPDTVSNTQVVHEPETKEIIFGGNQGNNNYKQKFNDIKKLRANPVQMKLGPLKVQYHHLLNTLEKCQQFILPTNRKIFHLRKLIKKFLLQKEI